MADDNTTTCPASPALTAAPDPTVVVRSYDDKIFDMPLAAAKQCGLLRDLLADTADFEQVDPIIPLDSIESGMLQKGNRWNGCICLTFGLTPRDV